MLSPAEKRRHAALLASRDATDMAQYQAALLLAEANLEDALEGREPTVAEHAYVDREYPILGKCRYEGGVLVDVEHPWGDSQAAACHAAGIDVAWQWCPDPAVGIEQGELIRIWIGTRDKGPRLQWDHTSGKWLRLVSRGNYGSNWACGGNWREDAPLNQRHHTYYATLAEADPEIAEMLAEITAQGK